MRNYQTLDNKIKKYKIEEPFKNEEYLAGIETENYDSVNEIEQTPLICNFFICKLPFDC